MATGEQQEEFVSGTFFQGEMVLWIYNDKCFIMLYCHYVEYEFSK